jgi:hypothetical protein
MAKYPNPPPVYEVAEAKVVDFYAAYVAAQRRKIANRARIAVPGFEEWFAKVYLKEAA